MRRVCQSWFCLTLYYLTKPWMYSYYGDAYIKTVGGQKKPTTMKIHNDLKDWLRHRGDLSEQDVDQYSYNHTYLMIKTEIARRRDDLGIRPHHRTAPTRTHPYAIMFGAYPPVPARLIISVTRTLPKPDGYGWVSGWVRVRVPDAILQRRVR
ncbi:hypothetical protein PBRA_008347 [Plasmodiophora brassicae]|uniref:Uncharacterized protein n=1 Tax=Plasmodiophora brassicae TaxID=37360 RepID=A0A0G4J0C6_PLABS|nr:hypothetical protein PBRA_008347 [Plasmodiophora brassicae]